MEEPQTIVADAVKLATMSAESIQETKVFVRLEKSGRPFVILPNGDNTLTPFDMSGYEGPKRQPVVSCVDVDSFSDYVNDYKENGVSRIFCDLQERSFLAVLDYHNQETRDDANACGHHVKLNLRLSEAAEEWVKRDRKGLSQAEFADFLEDRYVDVVEPTGADILEVAKTLEMKPDVHFKSAQRDHDAGYNLVFEETAKTTAGREGKLEVPSRIKIRIPLFEGADPVDLEARMLYRMSNGVVTFSIRFIRLEETIRVAVRDAMDLIQKHTELPTICASVAKFK